MTNLVINMSGLPKQQYISWKGGKDMYDVNKVTNSTVPTNSNPMSIEKNTSMKYTGKANPINHWRKQLIPAQGLSSSSTKVNVSQVMDRPGGSNHLVSNPSLDCENCLTNMKNYISKEKNNPCTYNPARITRSASTKINKNYYTTSKAYLKSRTRLHDQNQTIIASTKNESGTHYNSVYCSDISDCYSNKQIIYKPNNSGFSKEGAVTSSNRIVKLKYDTIQKINNKNECCDKNALQYRGNAEAPYYLKSKMNLPANQCLTKRSIDGRQPKGGVGIHTVCFKTLSSDLQHKKGTLLSSMIGTGSGKIITPQLDYTDIVNICNDPINNAELINRLQLPCDNNISLTELPCFIQL